MARQWQREIIDGSRQRETIAWKIRQEDRQTKPKRVVFHIDNLSFHTAVSTWAADGSLGRRRDCCSGKQTNWPFLTRPGPWRRTTGDCVIETSHCHFPWTHKMAVKARCWIWFYKTHENGFHPVVCRLRLRSHVFQNCQLFFLKEKTIGNRWIYKLWVKKQQQMN